MIPSSKKLRSHIPHTLQYVVFFLVAQILLLSFLFIVKNQSEQRHIADKAVKFESQYHTVFSSYSQLARLVYGEIVNKPDNLVLLNEAEQANEPRRQELRQELHRRILPTYQNLQKEDFRQFHFHFADGTSFLRMHLPDEFGDNLFDVRPSVRLANSEKRYVAGFELGRHFHAFRYVFPLSYNDRHLGSVEISVPFYSLRQGLITAFPADYCLILHGSVAEKKLLPDCLAHYFTAWVSDDYMMEKADSHAVGFEEHPGHISTAIRRQLNQKIKTKAAPLLQERQKAFSLMESIDGKVYSISFLPIINVEDQAVGFLVSYAEDATFAALRKSYLLFYFITTILTLLIMLLYRWSTLRIVGQLKFQQNLIDSIPIPVCFKDVASRYLGCNVSYEKFLGSTHEEIIGRKAGDFLSEEKATAEEERESALLAEGGKIRYEDFKVQEDDTRVDFIVEKTDLRDAKNNVVGMVGVRFDITDLKKAEEVIQQHNDFLVNIIESLPYPFYVIDVKNHKIILANSRATTNKAYEGMTCHSLTHLRDTPCDDPDHICPLEEVKKRKEPVVVEHIHKDNEGRDINVEVHGYPIFDQLGNVDKMIEYSIDITPRRLQEEEREKLIGDLQEALDKVKVLSGFLPICSSCKNIRDDKGYWNRIDSYISEHSQAEFTHGICPDCVKKLYPDYLDD